MWWERMYLAEGHRAHWVHRSDVYGAMAACGTYGGGWWLGTGDQAEYEKAEALPVCRNCAKKVPEGKPQ